MIDEAFVQAVEYEYAVKYLEHLGIEPTAKNIQIVLAMAPFKDCKIVSGWESSGYGRGTNEVGRWHRRSTFTRTRITSRGQVGLRRRQ